jgi:hypothetical protein
LRCLKECREISPPTPLKWGLLLDIRIIILTSTIKSSFRGMGAKRPGGIAIETKPFSGMDTKQKVCHKILLKLFILKKYV